MSSAGRQLMPLMRAFVRNLSKSCKQTQQSCPPQVKEIVPPGFAKLKQKQKKFQVEDGVPVYLKAGFGDKLLYQTSWLLLFIGTGLSVECFWKLAVPQ